MHEWIIGEETIFGIIAPNEKVPLTKKQKRQKRKQQKPRKKKKPKSQTAKAMSKSAKKK
jgi:hypothetical protein